MAADTAEPADFDVLAGSVSYTKPPTSILCVLMIISLSLFVGSTTEALGASIAGCRYIGDRVPLGLKARWRFRGDFLDFLTPPLRVANWAPRVAVEAAV
jgi:hypothetical protein